MGIFTVAHFTIIQKDDSIHFLGIESPGLTAAPALVQQIKKGFS